MPAESSDPIAAVSAARSCQWATMAVLLVGVVLVGGCSKRGPVLHRVHGTVTYAGKPVPVGRIVFDPDVMKGNGGPQGFAVIEGGRFDTAVNRGKGTCGGPMVITIDGYEPEGSGRGGTTRPLVTEYKESRDLPKANATLSIDIQATKDG